jgi:hypothetical protein
VYNKVLFLIIQEKAKLHKAENEATLLAKPCCCTIQSFIRVLCFHNLAYCLSEEGQVLLEDIHPFW